VASLNKSNVPENLIEAVRYFADPIAAHDFMVRMRWADGKVTCPRCGSDNVGVFSRPRMVSNCKSCRKQFTVKVGTIFEDSPLPLTKWLPATWMICNAKNGVSSCELARSIDVTQKTAWFMLHRIRKAMKEGSFDQMGGRVESDETFIGGRSRFMHKSKWKDVSGWKGKTPVQGLLERTAGGKASRVRCKVIKTTRKHEVQGNVREYVLKGSELYTDALRSYIGMNSDYMHQVIDHAIAYAKGHVHTNGLENFWCLLKRTIKGTYVNVEPFHLTGYLDEQAFRFNERKDDDAGRFVKVLSGIVGRGIRYVELIGKTGGQELKTATA
jgi:transposase-like protein